MRPAQIRVFDGLRMTTQHVTHLQDAWRSSVQDLRELAGLGRVQRGFQVAAGRDGSVTVQPGLGFDSQGNRVALDEPVTLQVTFGPGEDRQFVCMKHEQLEDGKVEEHFTLIWERGAVVLRPSPPSPDDDLIVVAELHATSEGTFTVAEPTPPAAVPDETAPDRRSLEQGLVRLTGQPAEGIDLATLLTAPLRERLTAPNGAGADLSVPLLDTPVAVSFAVLGLSCDSLLSVVAVVGAESAELSAQATAHGEVTFGAGEVAQFGLASIRLDRDSPPSTRWTAEAAESGVAEVPLGSPADPGTIEDVLGQLALRLRVAPDASGFRAVCHLVWRGSVREDLITRLAADKPRLRWQGVLGWKAQAPAPGAR